MGSAAKIGAGAAAGAALAALLPWASVSVQIAGIRFSGAVSAKGTDVGSVAGLSYGWLIVILALPTLLAFARPSAWLLLLGGVTGCFGLYAAITAVHHVTIAPSVDKEYVDALLQPHVAARFGVYLEALAACTILAATVVAFRASREVRAEQPVPRPFRLN